MPQRTPDYVVIGKITKPHGIRGQVHVLSMTEDPARYQKLRSVFLNRNGERCERDIERVNITPTAVLLQLSGISDRTEAEAWRGALVEIAGQDVMPLPEGQHYYFELDGLTVETEAGQVIGKIVEVLSYPAQDLYVVKSSEREYLIPAVPAIVKKVDTERQVVVINAIDGLLD
jgi:16S rRNA processing protein RimM